MALVRATHAVYGTCLIPESRLRLHPEDWTAELDPAEHTAAVVIAHLRRSDAAEHARIRALELATARPRKTVLAAAARAARTTQPPVAVGAGSITTTRNVLVETTED